MDGFFVKYSQNFMAVIYKFLGKNDILQTLQKSYYMYTTYTKVLYKNIQH